MSRFKKSQAQSCEQTMPITLKDAVPLKKSASQGDSPPQPPRPVARRRLSQLLYKSASGDSLCNWDNSTNRQNKYITDDLGEFDSYDFHEDYVCCETPIPVYTSVLKPGSRFIGTQQSGRTKYSVSVVIQSVNFSGASLTGYLKIEGLTDSNPEIITFFEAEIVSGRYSFTTDPSWGSNPTNDLQHWTKFAPFKTLLPVQQICSGEYEHKEFLDHPFIYMRWKEKFLIPDADVRMIDGASYDGFYYICLNQKTGGINGLYYHKSSEKFQSLEMVWEKGPENAFEFR